MLFSFHTTADQYLTDLERSGRRYYHHFRRLVHTTITSLQQRQYVAYQASEEESYDLAVPVELSVAVEPLRPVRVAGMRWRK